MGYLDTDHVITTPGTVGLDQPTLWQSLTQGYEQQYRVDSPYSLEAEIKNRWQRSIDTYASITGEAPNLRMDLSAFNTYARTAKGEDPSIFQQSVEFGGQSVSPELKQDIANFQKVNAAMKALGRPDIQSFEEVLAETMKAQAAVEQTTADVSERGGITNSIAQFIGGVAGSFSERDPVSLGTLGLGGFGRTIGMKVISEGLVQGSVAAVQEYGAVEPNRALAGLPEGSPVQNILMAAVLGAGLRGAAEGVGVLTSKVKGPEIAFDFNDTQLATMFKAAPESPTARAGLHMLEGQQAFEKINPYGTSPEGGVRFIAELEDVQRVLRGQTDTAIARVLPPIPIDVQLLDADIVLVRGEAPDVHTNFVEAETRLQEIDTRLAEVENVTGQLGLSDAVTRLDPDSGNLVKSLEEDLRNPQLTVEKRAALETKIGQIVETLGEKALVKELDDARIGPKKELQSLRKSRKAAVKEFRAARLEMEGTIARLRNEQRIKEMSAQTQSVPLAGFADAPSVLPLLRHESIDATVAETAVTVEAIPDRAVAVVKTVITEEGLIDLGEGMLVVPDFQVELTMADGTTRVMSVQKAMDDMAEDMALEEAMKVCSL